MYLSIFSKIWLSIIKHLVGLAIRLKYVKPPPVAKDIPIGQRRKRGKIIESTYCRLIFIWFFFLLVSLNKI